MKQLGLLFLFIPFLLSCQKKDISNKLPVNAELDSLYQFCEQNYVERPSTALPVALRIDSLVRNKPAYDSLNCWAKKRLAALYFNLGKTGKSLAYYDSFFSKCGRRYPMLHLAVKINMAEAFSKTHREEQAIKLLKEAEKECIETENDAYLMAVYQMYSAIYVDKDPDKFKMLNRRILKLAKKLGNKSYECNALESIGLEWLNKTPKDSGFYYLHLSRSMAKKHDLPSALNHIFSNLSLLHQHSKNHDSAFYYFKLCRVFLKKEDPKTFYNFWARKRAYTYYEQKEYRKAFQLSYTNTTSKDSFFSIENSRQLSELEVRYDTAEKEKEILQLKAKQRIDRLKLIISSILGLLIFIVALFMVYYFVQKRKQDRLQAKQEIEKLKNEKDLLALESVVFAQEEERQRIAKDLHDSIGALLSTARMQINKVVSEINKLEDLQLIQSTESIIMKASKEVRRVSHNMMPGLLMELGLEEALHDFFDQMASTVKVDFSHQGIDQRFSSELEIMCYRIVQEMVHNCIKHADTDKIELSLSVNNNFLELDYKDEGKGFDPKLWDDMSNLGLNNIRSRSNFLKGKIKLQTGMGKGTQYHILIPISHEQA